MRRAAHTPPLCLPPSARSHAALGLTAAAACGRFELQVCAACGAVQYPPREACHRCLSGALQWREQPGTGELIADTTVHHSNDLFFRERLPWRIGMVRLDAGPAAVVHVHAACAAAPARVRVGARLDKSGRGVLVAFPIERIANMADDPHLHEMTCDPKARKILVTDGRSPLGQALVRALIGAGADLVWVGYAESGSAAAGLADLAALPQAALLPLDLTDCGSVQRSAEQIGGQVDILINTAELHRAAGIAARNTAESHGAGDSRSAADCDAGDSRETADSHGALARAQMDVNYFGLLRLAREFAPRMRARGADGRPRAVAWVNLSSIYAHSSLAPHETFCASKAAALSLSQCLRAEMRPAGIRVINVFPGPIGDAWNPAPDAPKLPADALARAVVAALQEGVEDVYPGEAAQQWLARWRESPKILEIEMGG